MIKIETALQQYDARKGKGSDYKSVKVDSITSLLLELANSDIPLALRRKTPETNSFIDLFREVIHNETTFVRNKNGELFRKVTKAVIDVVHRDEDGNQIRLFEELFDGTNWVRRNQEPTETPGLKEKAIFGEMPIQTAVRGLEEEMGISYLDEDDFLGLVELPESSKSEQIKVSDGYPGLNTIYGFNFFIFELPNRFYKPEYYFNEGKRRMRLKWEKIE